MKPAAVYLLCRSRKRILGPHPPWCTSRLSLKYSFEPLLLVTLSPCLLCAREQVSFLLQAKCLDLVALTSFDKLVHNLVTWDCSAVVCLGGGEEISILGSSSSSSLDSEAWGRIDKALGLI